MLENWARAAGFFAVLAAVMGLSWLWALQDVLMPINPPEWSFPSCEAAKGQQSKKSQDKQNEPSEQSIASQQTPPRDGGSNSATEGHDKYYECLIAEFTRKLAVATRWLVIATLLLFITSLGLTRIPSCL